MLTIVFNLPLQLFQLVEKIKKKAPVIILLFLITIYSIILSYATMLKLRAFGMYAWDFGIYCQAVHTTVTSGEFFYTTVELPYTQTLIPSGTQFGVHFSPILFLILPFYALFPSPNTLLIIQSIVLALGAVPVFLIVKRYFCATIGLIFAGGYLLYPALHAVNWYDFAPQKFFPTFVLFVILSIELDKIKPALLFSILALGTVEIAPFFMIALGTSYLIQQRKIFVQYLRQHKIRILIRSLPLIIIIVSIIYLGLIFVMSLLFGWHTGFHASNLRRISLATSLNFISALSFDWQAKLIYLLIILGSFAFLSLWSPIFLFPGCLWIFYALLSNYPPYYSISFHYPSFVIPFVIFSSILGFKRLALDRRKNKVLLGILISTICFLTVVASPLGPFHIGNHFWSAPFGVPAVTEHHRYMQKIIELIPEHASILTSNNIFPHVAQRKNAYVFPYSATFPNEADFYNVTARYLQEVDFILFDGLLDPITATILFSESFNYKSFGFGIYAEADGIILLKRDYSGNPILFIPHENIFTAEDLVLVNGIIIDDQTSESKKVLYYWSPDRIGDFWYGPGVFLSTGSYVVEFRMKIFTNSPTPSINLAVVEWECVAKIEMLGDQNVWFIPNITLESLPQRVVSVMPLHTNNVDKQYDYQTFYLKFAVNKPSGYEFVGLSALNGTAIYLDYIKLIQVSP